MTDMLSVRERSERMSRIRSSNNKNTELALAKLFRRNGITGWRRHQPIFGKPDFVFRRFRLAIFVDGCFWHGCPKHSRHAKKSGVYWVKKLAANRGRDWLVTHTLRSQGWRVVRIWEHELAKSSKRVVRRMDRILKANNDN